MYITEEYEMAEKNLLYTLWGQRILRSDQHFVAFMSYVKSISLETFLRVHVSQLKCKLI